MYTNYYLKNKYNKVSRGRRNGITQLVNDKAKFILDIGCGKGILGEAIKKEKKVVVYGVDISPTAIEEAKDKIDKAFCVDIEKDLKNWPSEVKNKKSDIIIISEVLEHLFYPEKLLENIKKLSHRETEIIITVPNVLFWKNRLKILFGHFDYKNEGLMDRGHIHFFTWESLQSLLWQTGYHIISKNNFIPTRGTKLLGKLFPGFFSYQFILLTSTNK